MHRALLLPATVLLAALTALALLGAAVAIRPPGPPAKADGSQEAANRSLAYAFYDAANAVIATGDSTSLAALVAADFIDRGVTTNADRDGLVRRLLALRAAAPGVRLRVAALAADGDRVVAHVHADGVAPPAVLDLRLDGAWSPWGAVDVFRVEHGQVVERWGPVGDPAPEAPMVEVALGALSPPLRALAVTRVTLKPGARHSPSAQGGPRLLIAEKGIVTLDTRTAAVAATASDAAPPLTLRAGEHVLLATRADFAAWNDRPTPATLLDVSIAAPAFGDPASRLGTESERAVAVEVVVGDVLVAVPSGPVLLAVGRTSLAPGEALAWEAAPGPVLVHVESGAVDLRATGSVPWMRAVAEQRRAGGAEGALAAGGGVLLGAGAAAEISAASDGPATLLVLTLRPADGQANGGPAVAVEPGTAS